MQDGGFVSYDSIDFAALLSRCRCSLCLGVRNMTTEEELEQRVNNLLDDRQKELEAARAAIQKLEQKGISEAVDRLNEILNKGGDRG